MSRIQQAFQMREKTVKRKEHASSSRHPPRPGPPAKKRSTAPVNTARVPPPVRPAPPPTTVVTASTCPAPSHHHDLPRRRDRRRLFIEESMEIKPTLPEMLPPADQAFRTGEGRCFLGDNFQISPGVLDTDSVVEPGVAARLIMSTILPRDEENLRRKDLVDSCETALVKAVQEVVYMNSENRSYERRTKLEMSKLHEENAKLREENAALLRDKHTLENEMKRVVDRKEFHKKEAFERGRELAEVRGLYIQGKNREFALDEELNMLRAIKDCPTEETTRRIRAEAVREYRLSQSCYNKRAAYSVGFVKHGFYVARSILEERRPKEDFSDLVYTEEVATYGDVDWRKYEPGAMSPNAYFDQGLEDSMSNIEGPWEPYVAERGAMIDAFSGLDEPETDAPEAIATTEHPETVDGSAPVSESISTQPVAPTHDDGVHDDIVDVD